MPTPVKNCLSVPITSLNGKILKKAGVKDSDKNGSYDYKEAMHLIAKTYKDLFRQRIFLNCGPFNKAQAMKNMHWVRAEMYRKSAIISNLFGCSSAVNQVFVRLVDHLEKSVIKDYFPIFQQKGIGRIGIGFNNLTGEIYSVGSGTAAEIAGIQKGDKLISVGKVLLRQSVEFKKVILGEWSALKATMYLRAQRSKGVNFKKSIVKECFGRCGSVVRVVIERNGKRMTFNLKRSLG